MKSKNAERLVIREFGHGEQATYLDDVIKAVELAEEDARERAVRAHCKACYIGELRTECGHRHPEICESLIDFKECYDNEN